MSMAGRRIEIRGTVQGVGFRPWVYRLAAGEGLTGFVRNDAAGVTIEAFGSEEALDEFTEQLAHAAPPAADIRELRFSTIPAERRDAFAIEHSVDDAPLRVSIPPDLPTCPDCLREMADPANRRFGYAFTNCTNCGPRFTIALDAPYDRPVTTMAPFEMCEACAREYHDPLDRRFHAQPNACPVCGPRLTLARADGSRIDTADPIGVVADELRHGVIAAVKGLGGYHLACLATDEAAVRTLRARKRREAKPFAVMVPDVESAEWLAVLTDAERALLQSPPRPIVLAAARFDSPLAPSVQPDSDVVGLMLPYTPLHHLLLRRVGAPLVMTSGNLSDEPLAYRNGEARERLAGIADVFLMHDRDIAAPCDDSVARIIGGRPLLIRRSRGYVPRSTPVSPGFDRAVLACGGMLKNAVCIGDGDAAHMGPHVGDLESVPAYDAFTQSIDRLTRFLRVSPGVVAYDLHPDYPSTRYALDRPEPVKIGVQHHHAHIASVMAEHAIDGPVIGVAYDGTGYGPDGHAWGGEILVATRARYERVATLRPIALAGGDAAIREPWRLALALIDDAFGGVAAFDGIALFDDIPRTAIDAVRAVIAAGAPLAHGAGRYFDAVAALVLERPRARFEGQLALALTSCAIAREQGVYDFALDHSTTPWSIDLRPAVRAIVADLVNGTPPGLVAAGFHNTLAMATAAAVRAAARHHGVLPVAMSGGCFQNPHLAERLATLLSDRFAVYVNQQVPPGDGGLALGQAVVAAAVAGRM